MPVRYWRKAKEMINKTVLLVERDLQEVQRHLDFFRNHNFRNKIEVVHSKQEALDYIFGTGKYFNCPDHEAPGLIFLDLSTYMTPDVKILKPLQMYLRTQVIPIIVLTSSDKQEKEIAKQTLGGVVGFIRKPLDITHFIEIIQHMGLRLQERDKDFKEDV
jgi:two-component system response regulator